MSAAKSPSSVDNEIVVDDLSEHDDNQHSHNDESNFSWRYRPESSTR